VTTKERWVNKIQPGYPALDFGEMYFLVSPRCLAGVVPLSKGHTGTLKDSGPIPTPCWYNRKLPLAGASRRVAITCIAHYCRLSLPAAPVSPIPPQGPADSIYTMHCRVAGPMLPSRSMRRRYHETRSCRG
jgi:hypothetical protein